MRYCPWTKRHKNYQAPQQFAHIHHKKRIKFKVFGRIVIFKMIHCSYELFVEYVNADLEILIESPKSSL